LREDARFGPSGPEDDGKSLASRDSEKDDRDEAEHHKTLEGILDDLIESLAAMRFCSSLVEDLRTAPPMRFMGTRTAWLPSA
jgi:hypothetical protein